MDEREVRAARDASRRLTHGGAEARRFQARLRDVAPRRYERPPVLYDESGYPIEERRGLAARVRRLIGG